jgi:hypothetical protein
MLETIDDKTAARLCRFMDRVVAARNEMDLIAKDEAVRRQRESAKRGRDGKYGR